MLDVKPGIVLDVLDTNAPALSTTSDVPVIETHPDAVNKPAAEEVKEAAVEETTTTEESAAPEQPESISASDEPKKPAKGVQKRLDELTKQREDAKREAESERAEKLRLLALLEAKEKPAPKEEIVEDAAPVKPLREQFADDEAYQSAIDTYVDERASFVASQAVKAQLAEQEKIKQAEASAQKQGEMRDAYLQRVEKAKEKYADYANVAESPDVTISIPMARAIARSEDGPEIAYYLGQNKDEAKRIFSLDVEDQLMELGTIAAKLKQPAAAKPVSAAPAPGKPIKATTETKVDPQEESMEAYAARRKKEMATARPGMRH
jgi:hypothetical protein